ncbi:MAG: phosphatase PAP2 family protein [Dysgonamonadaceae bacterium]|jgi:membrane-associated phospholipid phosphatase|nr:phosphatase PAP2 family protein [Dysgonamonadaceae bacterium]
MFKHDFSIHKNLRFIVFLFFIPFFSLYAQIPDTASVVVNSKKEMVSEASQARTIAAIVIPTAMVTYGFISIKNPTLQQLDQHIANNVYSNNLLINNNLDDYLKYSPAVVAYGMKLAGVESKHNLLDMSIIYFLSNALEASVVQTSKNLISRMRPDGSKDNSFPSGHTATAFVAAEFLHQEYKDQSVWIGIGGYTMASLVGIARVLKDQHWFSDIITGAGIGIISTKIIYWLYPHLQELFSKKRTQQLHTFICPSYDRGALTLNFSCNF